MLGLRPHELARADFPVQLLLALEQQVAHELQQLRLQRLRGHPLPRCRVHLIKADCAEKIENALDLNYVIEVRGQAGLLVGAREQSIDQPQRPHLVDAVRSALARVRGLLASTQAEGL